MDFEIKIKELETKLEAAQTLIAEMTANGQTAELTGKITEMTAEIETLQAKITATETATKVLNAEIETLKTAAISNEIFIVAGKAHIDGMKAKIKKTSVQVDGDAYNEGLVDKQLEAFGNDVEMLTQFKVSLETRRSGMIKTGEIVADLPNASQTETQTAAEEYKLGAQIIPLHMQKK